jgi:CBS domain-containing protein
MRPLSQLKTISPDAPLTEALAVMAGEDLNQLPVMSNGRLHRRSVSGYGGRAHLRGGTYWAISRNISPE